MTPLGPEADAVSPDYLWAALDWQRELGVEEPVGDVPVNRYALADPARPARVAAPVAPVPEPPADTEGDARAAAAAAPDLAALAVAMQAAPSDLRPAARNFVFADGNPAARLMIVGEAPGREEDLEGRPFVGPAGQLLDRMLAAIGIDRRSANPGQSAYITNVLPWRPPGNRTPEAHEIALFLPFLERHVALIAPKVLILMGNTPCQAVLGRTGITRMRGQWTGAWGLPVLPMLHPAYLLRNPAAKRETWADLLDLRARLDDPS